MRGRIFFMQKHTQFKIINSVMALVAAVLFDPSLVLAEQSRGISMQAVSKNTETPFAKGIYRALIIGNNQYNDKDGRWKSLKTAVSDSKSVEQLLTKNYGFSDVQRLENASRRDVLKALDSLSQRVMKNDNVLVYYAGHGFMNSQTNKGFWVPVDAQGTDSTTFLRNSTIRDELTTIASRAKHTLLVSDSCFSGSLLRAGNRGISIEAGNEKYYKKVANKKSVQIMAAGGVEFVDDNYKTSGHSPFTYFLLSELKNNDRPMLTVSELSTNVEKAVANNVDQIPESGVLQGAGDELGEFIFIKLDVAVEGVDPERVKLEVNVVSADKNKPIKTDIKKKVSRKNIKSTFIPIPTL
jgi:hypothetical protein